VPEILFAAEQQLEAADGIEDTPFVTVKVTLDENSMAVVEAFQVINFILIIDFPLSHNKCIGE
jgi:hypothetical protein